MNEGLKAAIPPLALHLCIDMQRMFAEDTEWRTPWMDRVAPIIALLCDQHADRTCFTRFIPPQTPSGPGMWKRYWRRWEDLTLSRMDPDLVNLHPVLAGFTPPAKVLDKRFYSPWIETGLHEMLQAEGVNTLVITGAETDICVLAAVLGAVDLGYRVVVVKDALCSVSDTSHDNLLSLYRDRFSLQIETAACKEVLQNWSSV